MRTEFGERGKVEQEGTVAVSQCAASDARGHETYVLIEAKRWSTPLPIEMEDVVEVRGRIFQRRTVNMLLIRVHCCIFVFLAS